MFLLSVYLFFMKILGSRKYMYKLVHSVENVCWLDGYTDFIFANYFVFPTLLGEAGSDCSSCIVLFDPLPALSLCLLHDIDTCSACISPLIKKHWIKQVIDQYFFHHCIMTLILSVTVARTYYVPRCVLYAEKSRDGAGPWTAFKTQLSCNTQKI